VTKDGNRDFSRLKWKMWDGGGGGGGMVWVDLALDRDRWQAVVNVVMILRVP